MGLVQQQQYDNDSKSHIPFCPFAFILQRGLGTIGVSYNSYPAEIVGPCKKEKCEKEKPKNMWAQVRRENVQKKNPHFLLLHFHIHSYLTSCHCFMQTHFLTLSYPVSYSLSLPILNLGLFIFISISSKLLLTISSIGIPFKSNSISVFKNGSTATLKLPRVSLPINPIFFTTINCTNLFHLYFSYFEITDINSHANNVLFTYSSSSYVHLFPLHLQHPYSAFLFNTPHMSTLPQPFSPQPTKLLPPIPSFPPLLGSTFMLKRI